MLTSVSTILNSLNKEVDNYSFGSDPSELYEPISYILNLGGKRLRPVYTLLSTSLFTDEIEKAIKPAMAVEVFHNFTLMHDDIMDKAPLRRGKPTVHEKWSSSTAILSGDVMLVKAYDLLMHLEDDLLKKGIVAFNDCASKVCEGQQMDMNFENKKKVSEEEYIKMISLKTAALLGFSLELGGIIGKTTEKNRGLLKEAGINIGIGFQLMDDLLDVYGNEEKFGKQKGGDILANKKTYLLIKAYESADAKNLEILKKHFEGTSKNPEAKIKEVTAVYDNLKIKEITEEKINFYFNKGIKCISEIDAPIYKKGIIKKFSNNLLNRES
jgi:geranylgeranyl diphosphate synthase type II